MPDQLDFENTAVAQRFLEQQRQYQERQRQGRPLTAAPPLKPEQPMISAEAQFAISQSAEAEIVQRVREQARLQATAQAAPTVDLPAFDASLSEQQLRLMLADAIQAFDGELRAVGVAERALARSQTRMDSVDSQLRNDFAELDNDIAAHHVAQIKADRHDSLPAALADAQARRGALIDDIAAAHRAHQHLDGELRQARLDLAEAAAVRVHLAAFIVAKHAEGLADQLMLALDRATELKRQLLSASAVWIATTRGATSLPLGPIARQAIHRELPAGMPMPAYTAEFKDWHDRLINDAGAQLVD